MIASVRETVALVLGLDPASVDERTSPTTVDGWDSERFVELVLALEERLGFQFTPDEISSIDTVGDIEAVARARAAADGRALA